ncbi:hypothetical protein CEE45_05400 [Candidatus Heimdallarchaeota archaeon B3_Heim]|nr:MAG: hypothetical protein CEE45_05400 [Candidatus Heimdallarchaeota archaeon B3_Heim]
MVKKSREIEIESLKTPKGDVPTVKGLETVIDSVFSEYGKIENRFDMLQQKLETVSKEITSQSDLITDLSKSFSDLIVILGILDRKMEQQQSITTNNRHIETIDLLTLKKDLSRILSKLESLMTTNER